MHAHASFTPAARVAIDDLCKDLTRRIQRAVRVNYGQTDCGLYYDAALCVASLPEGAWGQPGPLFSILAGPALPDSYVVMGADAAPLTERVGLAQAVKAARFAGVRRYRKMVEG